MPKWFNQALDKIFNPKKLKLKNFEQVMLLFELMNDYLESTLYFIAGEISIFQHLLNIQNVPGINNLSISVWITN